MNRMNGMDNTLVPKNETSSVILSETKLGLIFQFETGWSKEPSTNA